MQRQRVVEPLQVLIWSTAGLIAALLGAGAAAWLYLQFHATAGDLLGPSVASFGLGLSLLGLAVGRRFEGIMLVVFAVGLVLGFALGGAQLAHLA